MRAIYLAGAPDKAEAAAIEIQKLGAMVLLRDPTREVIRRCDAVCVTGCGADALPEISAALRYGKPILATIAEVREWIRKDGSI